MKYPFSILPWPLLAAGSVVIVLCAHRLLDRQQLQSNGRTTTAIVKWATRTGARSNQIQVAFRDATGKKWTKDFAVLSTQYRPGQSADLVYLPSNPQIAILGPTEAGVTSMQEVVGAAVGALVVLVSAGWLAVFRGRQQQP